MSHFMEMDWNTKWDWESFAAYGSKTTENSRRLQVVDWTIIDDGDIDVGSFNLSMGGGNSGASGSDAGHVSSAKSSISASDSDGLTQDFRLVTYKDFSGNVNKNTELEVTKVGSSPMPEASIVSAEPLIGLKLGKRTYFENCDAGGHIKSISSVTPSASTTTSLKKTKSQRRYLSIPHCIVGAAILIFQQLKNITGSIEFATTILNPQKLLSVAESAGFASSVVGSITSLNLMIINAVVDGVFLIIMHDAGSRGWNSPILIQ